MYLDKGKTTRQLIGSSRENASWLVNNALDRMALPELEKLEKIMGQSEWSLRQDCQFISSLRSRYDEDFAQNLKSDVARSQAQLEEETRQIRLSWVLTNVEELETKLARKAR